MGGHPVERFVWIGLDRQLAKLFMDLRSGCLVAQTPRNIADVTERRRKVTLGDLRIEVLLPATAYSVDKVGEVVLALAGRLKGADQFSVMIKQRITRDRSLRTVEQPTASKSFAEGFGFQTACFGNNRLVPIVEDTNLGVGRFPSILVPKTAAVADRGATKPRQPQAPATNIDRMDIVIAEFSVAGLPIPVPVVVEVLARQRAKWCRAEKEVVIDIRRYFIIPFIPLAPIEPRRP